MVYFKKDGDSTFYFRYLNIAKDIFDGNPFGSGVKSTLVESLSQFQWSAEWVLYKSPPGPGGYNYAGTVHPEFFNRDYYGGLGLDEINPWYGRSVVGVPAAGEDDGKHLMLSWTSQLQGGANTGIYQIMMAVVEFNSPNNSLGSHELQPTSTMPTSLPKSTPSPLPSSFVNQADYLHDGHSLWTMVYKLVLVGAVTRWLTMII